MCIRDSIRTRVDPLPVIGICAVEIIIMAEVVDVSSFLADTLSSRSLQSEVPEITRREECCMGIDEAGRGPVLGQRNANRTPPRVVL